MGNIGEVKMDTFLWGFFCEGGCTNTLSSKYTICPSKDSHVFKFLCLLSSHVGYEISRQSILRECHSISYRGILNGSTFSMLFPLQSIQSVQSILRSIQSIQSMVFHLQSIREVKNPNKASTIVAQVQTVHT